MPPPPVTVSFTAGGVSDVLRAFGTIEQATQRATRARASANSSAFRGFESLGRAAAKQSADEQRAAEKTAATRQRLAEKTTREEERSASGAARAHERAASQAERAKERSYANMVRAMERAETQQTQIAAREASKRQQIAEQAARAQMAHFDRYARALGNGVSSGTRRTTDIAMSVGRTAVELGGGFSIADSVKGRMELGRNAALLANSASGLAGVSAKDVDTGAIMARARAASVTTGIDANDLVTATRSYVAKSSDFKGGMENMEFFGQLSKATGTDIGDITKAAGLVRAQNKGLDADGMKRMLLSVVMQGKQGAVEIEDLARSAGKVTRSATAYSGDQTVNQQKLLGLSQIAFRTAGSTDSAAVALSSLGTDTRAHSAAISNAVGYNVLNAHGQITKSPEELLADVMGATGGNLAKLGQHGGLGFTKPAMKIFEALSPTFNEAQAEYLKLHPKDEKGANKAGAAAALQEMQGVTGATMDMKGLDEMFQRVFSSPAEQFEAAMRDLKQEVGAELLPEFLKLVPTIRELTPVIVDLAKTALPAFVDFIKSVAKFAEENKQLIHDIAEHPIGAIMAKEVSMSIANAAIGDVIRNMIQRSATGGGGGVPGSAGAGGGGNGAGALAGIGMMAAAGYDLYNETGSAMKSGKGRGALIKEGLTSNDPRKQFSAAQALLREQQASGGGAVERGWMDRISRGAEIGVAGPSAWLARMGTDKALNAAGLQNGGDQAVAALGGKEAATDGNQKLLLAAMQKLAASMDKVASSGGGAGGNADPNAPPRNGSQASPSRGGAEN